MSDKRTAEEWGRVAVSLPGWRWMPGMLFGSELPHGLDTRCKGNDRLTEVEDRDVDWPTPDNIARHEWPYPDDHATAGSLLALLGGAVDVSVGGTRHVLPWRVQVIVAAASSHDGRVHTIREPNLGRACIAAAEALGRWPGGEG